MIAKMLEETLRALARNSLPKWEIRSSDFGMFIALLFSCMGFGSFLAAKIANWILAPDPDLDPPLLSALAANIGMQSGMLVAFLVFGRLIRDQDFTPKPAKTFSLSKSVFIGLKWLLIAYPVMMGVNLISRSLLDALGFEQVIQDPIKMVQEGGTTLELVVMYTTIMLVAPLCEEVAFRGGIFRFVHQRMPLYASLGLSAFFFALLHINLYSFAPLMTIGVMLALAYRESGSLVSNITFHAVFNSINLVLILFLPDLT